MAGRDRTPPPGGSTWNTGDPDTCSAPQGPAAGLNGRIGNPTVEDDVDPIEQLEAEGSQAGAAATSPTQQQDQNQGAQPAPNAAATPPANEDPADRELREAQEALKAANEGGAPAAAQPEVSEPAAAQQPGTPAAEGQSGGKAPATVPVAVARAERAARQKAEQEAAYWKGVADVLNHQKGGQAGQPGQTAADSTPELTPQERLDQIRQQRVAIADKYDNGEIKTREWEERRLALEDEERQVRESLSKPQAASAPPVDLTLEERTRTLETDYPIITKLTAEDLQPLAAIAYREAAKEGKPIQPGALGTLELRTRVAQIATRVYGTGASAPASNQQPVGTPSGSQPGKSGAPAAAPAQHPASGKADLAASHPVDAGSLGSAAQAGGMSDAEVEAKLATMSLDEQADFLASMPALVQRVTGQRATR